MADFTESTTVENMGVGGWFGDTAEGGASAICQTVCSPCMLCLAIILVFYGEYNYVKDLNNIYTINTDMVDGVTAYDAANDGKPVAFYGATVTGSTVRDPAFGAEFTNVLGVMRKAFMVTVYTTETKSNNQKRTTCNRRWSKDIGTAGSSTACTPNSYNGKAYKAPCPAGTTCDASYTGSATSSGFTMNEAYLFDDYTMRTTATVPQTSTWGGNWQANTINKATNAWTDCNSHLSNNYQLSGSRPGVCNTGYGSGATGTASAERSDHSVTIETYPAQALTVCSKQEPGGTFSMLKSGESYDIMIPGKKTKSECIDIMKDEAAATVFFFRIIGFLCFWCGFCMMFSIVSFFADRVGQLIPCGVGQGIEDMVQCLIAIVTCPPACACWLFWFALAWLIFRPLVGGIVFVCSLCLFGGIFYMISIAKGKDDDEKPQPQVETTEQPSWQQQQPVQEQPPQKQGGGFMNNMMNQANAFVNNPNQATPWANNQQPTQAPPQAMNDNQDLNNDGIPDKFQSNLPPNFAAAIDRTSNRVYWINYNVNPPASQWNDPRQVPPPGGFA